MKDNRFIELVNLYVDRQITVAETAELEDEIQGNPRRRAIYRQYCQVHRATALVYESFRADTPGQQPAMASGRANVAHFEKGLPRRRTHWLPYAGGLMAACLALVFVRVNSSRPAETSLAAVPKPSHPAVAVAVQPPAPAKAVESRPGLVVLRNNPLVAEQDYAAMLALLRQEERKAFADGQNRSGRLPSLFDDGVFESPQPAAATGQWTFRGKQTPAQPAESTSFQFQR